MKTNYTELLENNQLYDALVGSINVPIDAVFKAVFDKDSFEVWDTVIHDKFDGSGDGWWTKRDELAEDIAQTFRADVELAIQTLREKAPGVVSDDTLTFLSNICWAVNWYAVAGYMLTISEHLDMERKEKEEKE